jgi:hypothetical protein
LVIPWAAAISLFAAALPFPTPSPPIKRELTPADAVSTVRVVENQLYAGERIESSQVSPDGERYVIRLVHGDPVRNGVWMDILTGPLGSLDGAAHVTRCAHLFTTGLGSNFSTRAAEADPDPSNLIRWVSPSKIAFLWSDARGVRQVMSLDTTECKARFLTRNPTPVFAFALSAEGTLLFNAQRPRAPSNAPRLWHQGFTISDAADAWSILHGEIEGNNTEALSLANAWFIRRRGTLRRIDIDGHPSDRSNPLFREVNPSPNGHYALIGVGSSAPPPAWRRYRDGTLQRLLDHNATAAVLVPTAYEIIDLARATSRALWNVPKPTRGQAAWSPSGSSILLAPTFLPFPDGPSATPARDNDAGITGSAAAILEVASGRVRTLPIDLTERSVISARWLNETRIDINTTDERGANAASSRFALIDDHWQLHSPPESGDTPGRPAAIHLETRQSLNQPPRIYAVDARNGNSRLVLDPNPRLLDRFKLGRVERIAGTLPNGREWLGQLIYPADYVAGQQYPLLIQSLYGHGFGPEQFSLDNFWGMDGMGLGPSAVAPYPGQLLATRNIAVLQLEVLHPAPDAQQAEDYRLAFETLAEQLIASGLIDRNKIALDGFSRNGYWVEYTLAHSKFPFAAAIAADNYDPSYFQSALFNWRAEDALANGAAAFGEGLKDWLARAPGFNAERIHTPLRIIGQSAAIPFIIGEWELYSRLKYLHRPVEMLMMPRVDLHPSHNPQNPGQIMAVQEGVIDWFSFWLTGREDPAPGKRSQYRRWRQMRQSREMSDP